MFPLTVYLLDEALEIRWGDGLGQDADATVLGVKEFQVAKVLLEGRQEQRGMLCFRWPVAGGLPLNLCIVSVCVNKISCKGFEQLALNLGELRND